MWLRALEFLQTPQWWSSSLVHMHTSFQSTCLFCRHPAPAMLAPRLGAKRFLSLRKQSPSNLSPLRSLWIHFTLTQRKTGNLRASLGAETEPTGKKKKGSSVSPQCVLTCALVCVQCLGRAMLSLQPDCIHCLKVHPHVFENIGWAWPFSHNALWRIDAWKWLGVVRCFPCQLHVSNQTFLKFHKLKKDTMSIWPHFIN